MRRIIILCFLAICIPSESFGEGIFGLKKGMSLEEIKKLEFGYIKQLEDDPTVFGVEQPKKPQGADYVYFVVIPEMGLMKVRFYWTIEANPYGDELKRKFDDLKSILSEKGQVLFLVEIIEASGFNQQQARLASPYLSSSPFEARA